MLVLIAESKTIGRCDTPVAPDDYRAHRPAFEAEAAAIMASLSDASAQELAADVKISLPLARRLCEMIYDFPNKSVGGEAAGAFTGVVFRALDYATLPPEARGRLRDGVGIISSLYGLLRPDDIVKPYRFDFTTKLAPGGLAFANYWRPELTRRLVDKLRSTGEDEVLDLLPADASRCVDWKRVREVARVGKADFRELLPGGKTRTPNAGRLKTLRGLLLRQIVTDGIESLTALASVEGRGYVGVPSPGDSGTLLFHTLPD